MTLELKYNICFCISGDQVLLLYRNRHPNRFLWNGIGGKIDRGESPYTSVEREVAEEAGIDLREADTVRFGGVVLWSSREAADIQVGMYAFVAHFDDARFVWGGDRMIAEGHLAWKPLVWACDVTNSEIPYNLPYFLPRLLQEGEPMMYVCDYEEERLLGVDIHPLDISFWTADRASSSF